MVDMLVGSQCKRAIVKPKTVKDVKGKKTGRTRKNLLGSQWSTYTEPRIDNHFRKKRQEDIS